jgi:hypothetical protein
LSTLERAIAIAAEAHAGQTDKGGTAPYVLHPLRVMSKMASNDERITAVLHDVVEDCPGWTFDRLREEGFSETIIAAVDSVTKRAGEPYPDQVRRAAANPIGRRVKHMDMIDSSDLSRISNPTETDQARLEKYKKGIAFIEALSGEAAKVHPTSIASTELARQTGEEFRIVDLTLSSNGSLFTHTQDTGPTAKLYYNREDYEFWLTIPPEAVGKLAFALLKDKFMR